MLFVKFSVMPFQDALNLGETTAACFLKLLWSCHSEIVFASVINILREHFLLSGENNGKRTAVIASYGSWFSIDGYFGIFWGVFCLFVCFFFGFSFFSWLVCFFSDRHHQKTLLTEPDFVYWKGVKFPQLWLVRNNRKKGNGCFETFLPEHHC